MKYNELHKLLRKTGCYDTGKVIACIEKGKDGIYSVYMFDEALDYSINGQGKTADDAIADFIAVYNDTKRFYEQEGMTFTEVEFEYKYDIQMVL